MACYKLQDHNSLLLPVVLSEKIIPGSFAFALNYLVDHELNLSALDEKFKNDEVGASANDPRVMLKIVLLPKALISDLGMQLGQRLEYLAPKAWRWQGRTVKLFDGTSVSMPDTPSNQAAYPQSGRQTVGPGFPMVRIGALIGLASGAVLAYGLTALRGKGTGEQTVLRSLLGHIQPGDIILADALLATWWLIHAI